MSTIKIGFDNEKYLTSQSESIKERIGKFGGKLYLEFGGKLFDDFHASRVLPGFQPDSKIRMLMQLKEEAEIVLVVNSFDIEKNKVRGDLGITYEQDTLRLIDAFRGCGLFVGSVVLTRFASQSSAIKFREKLEALGIRVFCHYSIEGYPEDIQKVISEEGYGKNEYIETERSLVVVTAPGPGSGKMAVCLSQLYHDNLRGIKAGYAKFETFPIWNLPLNHPVNLAYEAATADLNDVNMLDPFHLEAYGKKSVNYNRDVEIFPVVRTMFEKIFGSSPYKSPTDMGVNMVGFCITDDEICRTASKNEIIRRYFTAECDKRKGLPVASTISKLKLLMTKAQVAPEDRAFAQEARNKKEETGQPAAALQLHDGRVVVGKTSTLLGASSALLLNALKTLAGIDKEIDLISREVIEPVQELKIKNLGNHNPRLHTNEVLIALSIAAAHDQNAKKAIDQLPLLKGCEVHSTVILAEIDAGIFRKLGMNLTCDPEYQTKKLFHN